MLRKTLVILRVLLVVFFIGSIAASQSDMGVGIMSVFLMPVELIVFLGLTTWIDSIDARLNPVPPVPSKTRNIKAIFALLITIITVVIYYYYAYSMS